MSKYTLYASAASGVEAVVTRELRNLGYDDARTENGHVFFAGDARAIVRTNLWLRTAERIHLQVGRFGVRTFDSLFELTKALPWEEWLTTPNACFPVNGKCVKSQLMSISDCQRIIKKAIVERLRQAHGVQHLPEDGPRYSVHFHLVDDEILLSLDTTGNGLHKRGYRTLPHAASLKETLAAAMLLISRWQPGRVLVDPFCGSGTIPIEAALIELNRAPGLLRDFDAQGWPNLSKQLWTESYEEARDMERPAGEIRIFGYDIDLTSMDAARHHARLANVGHRIHFQQQDFRELRSPDSYGFIVCNPPYGERMGEKSNNAGFTRDMYQTFSALDTWSWYVLSGDPLFDRSFGRPADKRRKLFNGGMACQFHQYFGPKPPKREKE